MEPAGEKKHGSFVKETILLKVVEKWIVWILTQ